MFARYRDGLEEELRAAMDIWRGELQREPVPEALYRMLQYHMGWADEKGDLLADPVSQGKALRPTLCLFTGEALSEARPGPSTSPSLSSGLRLRTGHSQRDWARALPAAAALELIHNFSLIHDDIQDGDVERRHRPTVWALWGQPQALVAGNAMRSLADIATLGLIQRGVSQEKALQTSSLLTKGYVDMIQGQCLDLAFESSLEICLEDYLTMISLKTGALIWRSMEMGALIACDDEDTIQAFANCGRALGLAFQIRDDVLGIWGDEATTGKAVGNDIRRKKKSFPIVYALEVAQDSDRQKLVDTYSKATLDDQDVQDVLTVLDKLEVANYAQHLTREKADLALREVSRVPLPSWARQEMEELVEFLAARQY